MIIIIIIITWNWNPNHSNVKRGTTNLCVTALQWLKIDHSSLKYRRDRKQQKKHLPLRCFYRCFGIFTDLSEKLSRALPCYLSLWSSVWVTNWILLYEPTTAHKHHFLLWTVLVSISGKSRCVSTRPRRMSTIGSRRIGETTFPVNLHFLFSKLLFFQYSFPGYLCTTTI